MRIGSVGALRERAACLAALALVALPGAARAAGNPRLAITINEKGVRYEISLPIGVFDGFFPVRRKNPDYVEPAERERAASLVEKALKGRNSVTIDGIRVKPVIESVEFVTGEVGDGGPGEGLPGGVIPGIPGIPGFESGAGGAGRKLPGLEAEPAAEGTGKETSPEGEEKGDRIKIAGGRVLVTALYGAMESPRQVSMVWELFPGPGSMTPGKMYAGLAAFDDWKEIVFSQEEPEYVWHALKRPTTEPLAVTEAPPGAGKVGVPVVTLVLLLAIPVFLIVARGRKLGARTRALVSGAVAVLAVALVGVGRAEVELPWRSSVERPGERGALEMFRTLHKNIYRAFDYKTEDDIYDVLAQSVDGRLLDAIYNEVYQGLILRDQGGAVCKIDTVDVLESKLTDPAEPDGSGPRHEAAFGMECRWRVKGSVHHWGHTHTRVNEYVALYTLEPRGESWKITAAQVLDEKRVLDATSGDTSGGGAK